ncbi:fatty acid synthase S-acetyltransferase [Byssothecium circinans]|uniref:Fatty acid synthase S-acetyltransferase n=1 Tax=Byssothecium circinans TaxID=147558 RepID=A0A6A5TEP1_9PLEO|nr:fatty acid synthase S-acetyltransferase [Byssothecium circinans]
MPHFESPAAPNDHSESLSNGVSTNGHTVNESTLNGNGNPIANSDVPIAICGLALRLPGGLKTPKQYWDFLVAGGDARSRVPESRYNVSAFHDPSGSGKPTTVPSEYGYFLDEDLGALDTSFFSMPRSEVEQASPEQTMILEVARECLEDAGETKYRGQCIGCYIGSFGEDWVEMFARENQAYGQYRMSGPGDFVISNRLSYELNINGPSMTVRTACSASLTALHEACVALSRGDCSGAVVGGTNLIMTPGLTSALSDQGVLSKDGSCKTFSADADGYARGEAITAIFIKRLDDAIRDGNPIRAVIRGSAVNSDGKTPGITCPSADAHERLIRRAYQVSGIEDVSKTGFVECHGTGTPTGDPIETTAVARVFGGTGGVYIGSVKPNLGHTEGASGLVSVLKVVLSLENLTIPPNIKMGTPNPKIPWKKGNLTVPLKPTPWPKDRLQRASVSSFGAGGANAHCIIDSAASFKAKTLPRRSKETHHLLLFSANSQPSLTSMIENYREYVEHNPEKMADLAYTLANRREHLPHRAFGIAHADSIQSTSAPTKPGQPPSIVMVFTGQGAQWPQMGLELLQSNPTFLATIRSLDAILQRTKDLTPEWKIEDELHKPVKKSRMHTAELSQPLCTAIQIGLVDALQAVGIQPSAVVGHSSGEIGAAYAAGGLTAKEAIIAALCRGHASKYSNRAGAMAAVGLSWEDTEKHLLPGINIACDNSPNVVTISGDADKVETIIANIRASEADVMARKLQVDKAYHSHHMLELSDGYYSLINPFVTGKTPAIPFFSTVTGKLLDESRATDARYWQQNLESPVRFRAAISNLAEHPIAKNAILLEIGPHSALAGPLRQTLAATPAKTLPYVSAMLRNQNAHQSLLSAIGTLYTLHALIDFKALFPKGACLPDLPRYPYNHDTSFWFESRLSKDHRFRQYPHHDLLGIRVLESASIEPAWRNLLHLNTVEWVRDHKVGDDIVLPMAGYIAMAGEAVRQISGIQEGYSVRRAVIGTALVLAEGAPTELITTFRKHRLTDSLDSDWWEFTICSHNGVAWKKHISGQVKAQSQLFGKIEAPSPLPKKVPAKTFYLGQGHLNLGPAFRNFKDITRATTYQRTIATILNGRLPDTNKYHLHPTVIDSILQLSGWTMLDAHKPSHETWLPIGVEEVNISRCSVPMLGDSWMRIVNKHIPIGEAHAIVDGNIIASVSAMKVAQDLDLDVVEGEDTHAAARQAWGPDIEFLNAAELVKSVNTSDTHVLPPFLKRLTHCKPNLRVLEVASGADVPSAQVVDNLKTADGRTLCSRYTFASKDAITAPEDQPPALPNLEYAALDLSEDLSNQGFEDQKYDLVVTSSIPDRSSARLKNIKSLLASDGYLLLTGSGADESGLDKPSLKDELLAAEFEVISEDVTVIAKPSTTAPIPKRIHLISSEDSSLLQQELESRGYEVSKRTLTDSVPTGEDVIILLDKEAPYFDTLNGEAFNLLKNFLHSLNNSGVFWVTGLSQVHVQDPRYSQVIGFARTMGSEMLIDFATCEVDDFETSTANIAKCFEKFQRRSADGELQPDFEYAIYNGAINVPRYYPFALSEQLFKEEESDRAVLDIETVGRLSTLHWRGATSPQELKPNEVEVDVHAAGLNFRDVLVGLKVVTIPPRIFGFEAAGIVRRVGAEVTDYQVGDRVAAYGHNMLATRVVVADTGCMKIPDEFSFEEVSCMMLAHLTAMYSLQTVGGLEEGMSVLIHSACGGVGLAAIQLAQHIGAEIYATVGNDEKAQFLIDTYHIPRDHIFHSRDTSFADGILRATDNEGVDVVLNSTSGELLHATWHCVAPFGKLIEIGKRDIVGHGKLDMDHFLQNRSYCCVDVGTFPVVRPKLLARHIRAIEKLLKEGAITPVRPVKVFDASSPYDAFRYMQPGTHIGRITISMRDSADAPFKGTIRAPPKTLPLNQEASYLLIGGLGGLGREIATWMVLNGARHLIFLSRSAGTGPEDEEFRAELTSMNCSVQFIQGSVTQASDVERAIAEAAKPLKGILQLSAIFCDENFTKMTIGQWNDASLPKTKGTWNLHNATVSANLDLDFFVLFSSLSGVVGQPGQANYASANTFLDAFVQYRNNHGLAASAIDIGAVEGIGYISRNQGLMEKMGDSGFHAVGEQQLLDALLIAMQPSSKKPSTENVTVSDPNTFVLGLSSTTPLTAPANRAVWKRDRRMAIYHNTLASATAPTTSTADTSATLRTVIGAAKANPAKLKSHNATMLFATEIGKKLFQLLLKPEENLNTDMSLVDLGMDSLVGIEMRSWWRGVFGFDVSVLEMLGMGSLEALGKLAAEGLGRVVEGKE